MSVVRLRVGVKLDHGGDCQTSEVIKMPRQSSYQWYFGHLVANQLQRTHHPQIMSFGL